MMTMNKPGAGWSKGGARWSTATNLKGQACATAPLAPPPYRGGQVVVAHAPVFTCEEISNQSLRSPMAVVDGAISTVAGK
jgi:hypothetical protein